jgi:hypothetical protein
MHRSLFFAGLALVIVGLLWAGQGVGLIDWPATSPMLGASAWTWRGFGLAVAGLALILVSRRRR